jgi:hypothetical protein
MVFVAVNATAALLGAGDYGLLAARTALLTAGILGAAQVAGAHTDSGVIHELVALAAT